MATQTRILQCNSINQLIALSSCNDAYNKIEPRIWRERILHMGISSAVKKPHHPADSRSRRCARLSLIPCLAAEIEDRPLVLIGLLHLADCMFTSAIIESNYFIARNNHYPLSALHRHVDCIMWILAVPEYVRRRERCDRFVPTAYHLLCAERRHFRHEICSISMSRAHDICDIFDR